MLIARVGKVIAGRSWLLSDTILFLITPEKYIVYSFLRAG